jgi:cell volume regulation protein A
VMSSLLAAGGLTAAAAGHAVVVFVGQMVVGGILGIVGARLLLWFTRRVALPSESLYPLRTLACVFVLYGATTALEGSGFLAVFVAGILMGDERMPYQPETAGFFAALSSIAEIVVFIALGLTVDLKVLSHADVWGPGLLIALVLTLVIRPVLVGLCLLPSRLARNEATFVLFAGLKGAVPILLGTYLLTEQVADGQRLYEIVVTVVLFSVFVQGGLVPWAAKVLKLPVRMVTPEPWSVRIRLENEPESVQRLMVASGSVADGRSVAQLAGFPHDAWISLILREQQLLPATGETVLAVGDQVVVLAHPRDHEAVTALFTNAP